MAKHPPLTEVEKDLIYRGKLQERTLAEVAQWVGCSVACARKWWRRGRDHGWKGLHTRGASATPTGMLVQFDARVAEQALSLKRSHRGWGTNRVRLELGQDPDLQGLRLPKRSRLSAFFKARCPECVAEHTPRPPAPAPPPRATEVHELWELDTQEGMRLQDGDLVSLCNVQEAVGPAMIASQAYSVKTQRHWRKLTFAEVRATLRAGFTEWHTLPDAVLTDHELCLAGSPTDPFPSRLTLWLRGLAVRHEFIRPHTPTDQPQVERQHRTLDGWALNDVDRANRTTVQSALDRERHLYNYEFPARAGACAGRPPVVAHPALLQPRRVYQPELELALFDLQRVYDYLATFTFVRKVNATGQVSVGRRWYSVGRLHAGATVLVYLDADHHEWVFLSVPPLEAVEQAAEELARHPPKDLDVQTLTGLDPTTGPPAPPVQLHFPFFP